MTLDTPSRIGKEGIVKLIGMSKNKDKMVIEFCEGGNLRPSEVTNRWGMAEVAEVTKKLVASVAYIHSKGIVHNDLKRENIMLQSKSGTDIKTNFFPLFLDSII